MSARKQNLLADDSSSDDDDDGAVPGTPPAKRVSHKTLSSHAGVMIPEAIPTTTRNSSKLVSINPPIYFKLCNSCSVASRENLMITQKFSVTGKT